MKSCRAVGGKRGDVGSKWIFFLSVLLKKGVWQPRPRNIDGTVLRGDSIHLTAMFIPFPQIAIPVSVCVLA